MLKFPFCLLVCAAVAATPAAAGAQTAGTYVGPKLLQKGTNATALGGTGDVTVQVFVKKDGTFNVTKVTKSSNPDDDAAALEIAKSSKYKPATRNGRAVDAYYDYQLTFAGDAAATGTGPVAAALATIRAGKYDKAKSDLQAYLQTHPADTQANTLLGVADTFGGDPAGAAAAFDKAGTVPDQYKQLALQSYDKYAGAALGEKKYPEAIAAANHALALNPQDLQAYFVRGQANMGTQNFAAAIADLQKARSIAGAAKSDDATLATLAFTLAAAQLDAGQFGEAASTAKSLRSDSARSAQLNDFAQHAALNAAIPLANQGQIAAAVSRLESAATAFPSAGGSLTAEAAYIMAIGKTPDWDKVKAEAEKALALDPNAGKADYILGVVASQKQDSKTALDYMNKAKASPTYRSDAALAKQVDAALKQLNTPGKPPL
ncbi:MAG TPA: tetratricopeptide repeat protein [Candidatus Lustribacter sp.]